MKKLLLLSACVISLWVAQSCKKESDVVAFEPISEEERDSLVDGNKVAFKGTEWKVWDDYFKTFINNSSWKLSERTYLGLSNNKSVGTLYNTSTGNPVILFTSFDPVKTSKAININPDAVGKKVTISGTDFNSLIGANVTSVGNAELQLSINNAKSADISVDKYTIEEIVEGPFEALVNEDETFKQYKEKAFEKKNRVIARALKVKGFSAMIDLDRKLSTSLMADLDEGVISKVADGKIDFKFSRRGDDKIMATSNSEFYVFVKLVKAKRMVKNQD